MNKKTTETSTYSLSFGQQLRIAGVLLLLGGAGFAGVYWERNSLIKDVRFTGAYYTDKETLQSAVELPIGLHPDSVSFGELMQAFQEQPYVKQTGVRVESGGRMVVDIEEREPLMLLTSGAEKRFVDREGVVMPWMLGKTINVPILHGFRIPTNGEPLAGNEFRQIRDFLVAAKKSRLGWATISEVGWGREEGVMALSQENGVKLIFGEGNFSEKIEYWDGFYESVVAEKGMQSFTVIDLRFRNQIVTR
ncbi:MAG: cell division protein FtsQ/DivIB [Balneolaceae bacterium]